MKGYQDVFQRIEKKYILDKEKYEKLMEKLNGKLDDNEYPNSTILNIYFDTDNYDLAIKSIQKPIFKEKIRLRSYNVPNDDSMLFLEAKRKYKGIIGKRRIAITKCQYEEYVNTGTIKNIDNRQIFDEIDYTVKKYNVCPKMFVAYDRRAYYLKENHNIRITLDFNLRSRNEDLDLYLGDAGKKFFKNDMCIMEIKSCEAIPIWFVKILNELCIYPTSFSKYGEIYKKSVLNCNQKDTYSINGINKDKRKIKERIA